MVRDSLRNFFSVLLHRNKDAEKRVRQLTTLIEITQQLTSTLELELLLQHILENAVRILNCEAGSLFLVDDQTHELVLKVAVGPVAADLLGQRLPPGTGMAGRVTQTRRPLIENDVQRSEHFKNSWDQKTGFITRSLMIVPMLVKDRVIGLIEIINRRDGLTFVEDDQSLLTAFVGQAAVAIENARLYEQAIQATQRREVLHRISQDIIRFGQDREQIYAAIHEATGKLMPCDVFIIALRNQTKFQNDLVYVVENGQRYEVAHLSASEGFTGSVMSEGKSLILYTAEEIDSLKFSHFGSPQHVQSVVAVPMRIGDKVIGMTSAQCYLPHAYGLEEQAILEMLSAHAATAIENTRLFEAEQSRRQEAETLRESLAIVASTLEKDVAIDRILEQLERVVPYNSASVQLIYDGYLEIVGGRRLPDTIDPQATRFMIDPRDPAYPILRGDRPYVLYDDVRKHTPAFSDPPHERIVSWLAVPLKVTGEIIGIIALDGHRTGQFTERHAQLAVTYGDQVAIALQNAKLYSEIQRELNERKRAEESLRANEEKVRELNASLEKRVEERTEQLQAEKVQIERIAGEIATLRRLSDFLQASLTIDEASGIIINHLHGLFPKTAGALLLSKAGTSDLSSVGTWGAFMGDDVIQHNSCWGIRRGRAYARMRGDTSPVCSHLGDEPPFESVCVPLLAQGEIIGMICLESNSVSEARYFSQEVQDLVLAGADSIALALANLRLREHLHTQSIRDGLTGLFNRRYLDETLPRELLRAERKKQCVSVLMFDIDHFKKFNDTMGHDAGDVVLKSLADLVLSTVRASDIACRYGGEEFTVILPDSSLEIARERAEQIRVNMSKTTLKHNGQDLGKVTLSLGVSTYPQSGTTRDELIKNADIAMYRAKENGRNQVVIYE